MLAPMGENVTRPTWSASAYRLHRRRFYTAFEVWRVLRQEWPDLTPGEVEQELAALVARDLDRVARRAGKPRR